MVCKLNFDNPTDNTRASVMPFLFPLIITLVVSATDLFWFYSQRSLHPSYSLVLALASAVFWTFDSIYLIVDATQQDSELAKQLGLSVPVACLGAFCTFGIALT